MPNEEELNGIMDIVKEDVSEIGEDLGCIETYIFSEGCNKNLFEEIRSLFPFSVYNE